MWSYPDRGTCDLFVSVKSVYSFSVWYYGIYEHSWVLWLCQYESCLSYICLDFVELWLIWCLFEYCIICISLLSLLLFVWCLLIWFFDIYVLCLSIHSVHVNKITTTTINFSFKHIVKFPSRAQFLSDSCLCQDDLLGYRWGHQQFEYLLPFLQIIPTANLFPISFSSLVNMLN